MGLFCGTWGGETIKWYPVATCWKPLQERETLSNNETNQYDMEHFPSKHGLWYSIHFFPKLFGMLVPNDNFSWNESTTNFFLGGGRGEIPFSHLWSGGSTFAGWLWLVLKNAPKRHAFLLVAYIWGNGSKHYLLPYLGNRHPLSITNQLL